MDYRFKTKPFQHQLDALKQSWNKEVWALFMEMGTGKTKVCIDNIAVLYSQHDAVKYEARVCKRLPDAK